MTAKRRRITAEERHRIIATQKLGGWYLDEADRLDKAAAELEGRPRPAPVANIAEMTEEWIFATLGPEQLRRTATDLRHRAAQLAGTLERPNP